MCRSKKAMLRVCMIVEVVKEKASQPSTPDSEHMLTDSSDIVENKKLIKSLGVYVR
jgi:hypothetical protein